MLFPGVMLACSVGGVGSVLIAGCLSNTLFANQARRIVAFAMGILLRVAFTEVFPEALNQRNKRIKAGCMLAPASLSYIALADLVPTLQTQYRPQDLLVQCLLITCGLSVTWVSPSIQQHIMALWGTA